MVAWGLASCVPTGAIVAMPYRELGIICWLRQVMPAT